MASPPPLVIITGVSGYIGGVLAYYALAAGYRVRGTVRALPSDASLTPLCGVTGPTGESLQLAVASLDSADGWADALAGATYVLHCASPVPVGAVRDADAEVVTPAVSGVTHVMRAALGTPTVRRVVLTSSIAAVMEGREAEAAAAGRLLGEGDWNDLARASPYARSKRLAEEAAWAAVAAQPPGRGMELAAVLPGLVVGPSLSRGGGVTSSGVLPLRLFAGAMPALPNLFFPAVDVRDVALAHLRAMVRPAAAGGRFIVVQDEPMALRAAGRALAAEFNPRGFTLPTWGLPSLLVRAVSYVDAAIALVLPMLDTPVRLDNARSKAVLGLARYRDASDGLRDLAYSLLARGALPDKSAGRALSDPEGAAARRWVPAFDIPPGELDGVRPGDVV